MPIKKKAVKKVTKKVTKKKASQKKLVKKTAKRVAEKMPKADIALICADGNRCFWTTDGEVIANLTELRDSFEKMADDVFKYHVTKEKNDFADWVEAVLKDQELGNQLRKSRKPSSARTVVVRRLKIYNLQ